MTETSPFAGLYEEMFKMFPIALSIWGIIVAFYVLFLFIKMIIGLLNPYRRPEESEVID